MTHTQTQGADGAGTNGTLWCMHIAGPDDVHAAPDFWTALAWSAELNAAVAARAIKQGWAGDDNWPLAQATVQRWPWSAEGHADSLATELAARAAQKATPAPAATPGVPDSLRALSEAADYAAERWTEIVDTDGLGDRERYRLKSQAKAARRQFEDACADHVRALIAAQPAGQAGDAGASPVRAALEASMDARGANRQQAFFREAAARIAPAPDSTRTGAAETGELRALAKRIGEAADDEFADWQIDMVVPVLRAALAARPEAPSDAGWSREDLEAFVAREWPEGRSAGAAARELVRALGVRGLAPTLQRLLTDLLGQINFASTDRAQILADFANAAPEAARMAKIDSFERWNPRVFDPTPPSDPAPSGQAEG